VKNTFLKSFFSEQSGDFVKKKSLNRKAFVVVVAAAVADMNELSFLSLFRYNKK